jgi:hypothetical protein
MLEKKPFRSCVNAIQQASNRKANQPPNFAKFPAHPRQEKKIE